MMLKIQLSPQEWITFYNLIKYKSDILNSNNILQFLLYKTSSKNIQILATNFWKVVFTDILKGI